MCWAVTPSIYGRARHPINPPVKIVSVAATLREEHKDEITRGSAGGGGGGDILFFFPSGALLLQRDGEMMEVGGFSQRRCRCGIRW